MPNFSVSIRKTVTEEASIDLGEYDNADDADEAADQIVDDLKRNKGPKGIDWTLYDEEYEVCELTEDS